MLNVGGTGVGVASEAEAEKENEHMLNGLHRAQRRIERITRYWSSALGVSMQKICTSCADNSCKVIENRLERQMTNKYSS